MRKIETIAIAATVGTALLNLPTAFTAGPSDLPSWLARSFTVFGIAGFAAIIAVLRHARWAHDAMTVVGALNAVGGITAVATGNPAGFVVLALGIVGAAFASRAGARRWAPAGG